AATPRRPGGVRVPQGVGPTQDGVVAGTHKPLVGGCGNVYSAGQPPHRLSRAPPSRGWGTSIVPGPVRRHNRRATPMDPTADVPTWLLRPLPVNAGVDPAAHDEIDRLARDVPSTLRWLAHILRQLRPFCEYDAAANRASAYVWQAL